MSKYRQAAKIDENQPAIVKELRSIGSSVSVNHDDILVGFRGRTWWIEIKTPDQKTKQGHWKSGALKDSQKELLSNWKGQYNVCTTFEEILEIIS